jgi:hypothetical protein
MTRFIVILSSRANATIAKRKDTCLVTVLNQEESSIEAVEKAVGVAEGVLLKQL